jgi:phosphoribosylaminoimidazole (AIR) synthetase
MGIGLVFVVSPYYAESIQQQLSTGGYRSWVIGEAVEGEGRVTWS